MSNVATRVKQIVSNVFKVREDSVKNESSFTNDFNSDSLQELNLRMAFEDEFNVIIPYDLTFKTVGEAIAFLESEAG